MKKLMIKFAKGLMKEQVKKMQSVEFEEMVGQKAAETIPDYGDFEDAVQKQMAMVVIDCCTDLLAESMDLEAD